ncbi:MAG: leucine-rich repeat domain-containing protein [Bacteroidales bacterium]|nr:leucine-rich repeat domain-containing protein [Bacteroidales bacterium]
MSKDQHLSDVMIRIYKLSNDEEADPRDSWELFQQNRAALMNRFFGTPVAIADEPDMSKLDDVITDNDLLIAHRISRQGFIFTGLEKANVYNAIIVRNPVDCDCWCPARLGFSKHSLEEHIAFINEHKLERAIIVAEDLQFITQCPSLKYLKIIPADTAPEPFDYSPLYVMPELRYLECATHYGGSSEPYATTIDYAQVNGVSELCIVGDGHLNYQQLGSLEEITLNELKNMRDLQEFSGCTSVKNLSFTMCGLRTLDGIEQMHSLRALSLEYMRTLADISALSRTADTLTHLHIEKCPKIKDFSCLNDLVNLESLSLHGKNELPDLSFLNALKKLKIFTFSMNVLSNDLTPCLRLPYAVCSHDRKTYNLKDKDLPKN